MRWLLAMLTLSSCGYACCNRLGIERAFITTSSGEIAVSRERVQDVLNVESVVNECDSVDLDVVLADVNLSLAELACVAR